MSPEDLTKWSYSVSTQSCQFVLHCKRYYYIFLHIVPKKFLCSRGDGRGTGRFFVDAILFAQMINKSIEVQNPPGASLAPLSTFSYDVTPCWVGDLLELL